MRIFLRSTITFAEKMTIRLVYISLMMASSVLPASLAAASEPPARLVPPVRTVTETHFGVEVADPYRYMEDVANPEVIHFMRGESAYARSIIDAIPGRAQLESRINELSQANTTVFGVQLTGPDKAPRIFYYRLAAGMNARTLYVRDGLRGAERLVFDPTGLTKDSRRYAIDYFRASPDGRYVVVAVAAGGSEETTIRIVEVTSTGTKDIGVEIDRIGFADKTSWAADGRSFFYNRLPPQKPGEARNRYLNSRAFRHVIGRPVGRDEMLFGNEQDVRGAGLKLADIDIPSVQLSPDGKMLVGRVEHGDAREISIFTASAAQVGSEVAWRRIIQPADGVTAFALHNQAIYLLTKKNAPRFKIVRMGINGANYANATTIVPQGDTVVAQIEVAQDALYIRELFGGVDRLQRLNFSNSVFSGGKLEYVRLPFDVSIRQLITSPSRPGALLRLESWTEPPKYVTVEERTANISDTRLHPKSAADFSDIVELRQNATASDGTKIPVSLIYRKSTTLNSFNPTLIRAYGAYGFVQVPTFNPSTLAWLERGGILATCHVRGGGEFGEVWHLGGQRLTKPNTWQDVIACTEYLIERGFTRRERVGIQGGSAGGVAVGRAMTERPDLFAAVVSSVGLLDAMRMEFTPNGPPNIPEFGSVKTRDGFEGLLRMSSLHHVKDGTKYPAVMLMHGVNDPRVDVWHSAKMAARLGAAVRAIPDANPVLLRLDYDAGHGVGSTRSQRNAELADIYSFLLWQFGEPGFQPAVGK
ncbi:MAG: prolyl oligopeptidase family serine peptidase [Rhodocyclaceae bacterium]|jgi:prolyl oligopeptidase|nr:prolyl oligopeptidase family serine peptidase [Rhodocyclaceae bacterium]MCE2721794.1 prolyl oligopeptidase family serine peptidase [Betaproteobacteria bacterium]MCA3022798.1 prolyl oligopeptidase family serine peptidase [Rhodocyclaceae bacterium]MCA3025015.1 prolyl oligopeptidase family serine peptidase [Rhodocyclaceae bacterium]MCA3036706.1 prolyl oligopeptidase family serine peptidase [Rhodocyclaceae bacterium]